MALQASQQQKLQRHSETQTDIILLNV